MDNMKAIKYIRVLSLIIMLWIPIGNLEAKPHDKEEVQLVGVNDEKDPISLYVKGIDEEIISTSVMAGNVLGEKVDISSITEQTISMRTYILIDNSMSIPEKERTWEKRWIENLIDKKGKGEEYAIATFGSEIEEYVDFTTDDEELKESLDNIEPQKRATYLSDVLYELLKSDSIREARRDSYVRIVVISDGVDKKTLGITNDELAVALNEAHIPIYTLGIYNKEKSNNDELKKMFAMARESNGQYLLIEDETSWDEATGILGRDQEILKFDIHLPEDALDGSLKTIMLSWETYEDEYKLNVDNVRVAQKDVTMKSAADKNADNDIEETDKEATDKEKADKEKADKEENVVKNTSSNMKVIKIMGIIIGILLVLGCGVFIFILFRKRRTKEKSDYEWKREEEIYKSSLDRTVLQERMEEEEDEEDEDDGEGTVMLHSMDDSDETVCIFDEAEQETIRLFDASTKELLFSGNLFQEQKIIIGRRKNESDVCISNDKTVSGTHCAIFQRSENYYLSDLQSQNGTFVNGRKISDSFEIKKGDVIKIGKTELLFDVL